MKVPRLRSEILCICGNLISSSFLFDLFLGYAADSVHIISIIMKFHVTCGRGTEVFAKDELLKKLKCTQVLILLRVFVGICYQLLMNGYCSYLKRKLMKIDIFNCDIIEMQDGLV